jgi:hypothetical protein
MSTAVELFGGDASCLVDLPGVGNALPGKRRVAEEPPPALLQVEPTGSGGDEHVVQAWMRLHPGPRLQAVMTRQVVGDQLQVPLGIGGFDGSQERDVLFGGACRRTPRQFLAVSHAQRAIDPGLRLPRARSPTGL